MIHAQHGEAVFSLIARVLNDLDPPASYRELFDRAVSLVRAAADVGEVFLPIDLPMAVADLLGRPEHERFVAAAASTVLWTGADLMDDAADGELSAAWSGVSSHQLALVSTNLLATLPHLIVGDLDDGDGSISAGYSQAVARTLFAMSEGQSADLESGHAVGSVSEYLAMIRRKSGAEFALFASTPALLAGADADTVAAWVRFGFAYGSMVQVFSDTVSTALEGRDNDLCKGKRTLPVLHTLACLRDEEKVSFHAVLDSASSGNDDGIVEAVAWMSRTDAFRFSFERVELLRYRAAQALPFALSQVSPDHPMRALLRACTVF
jgi:geranylgeranyl pyrophosphate synthase